MDIDLLAKLIKEIALEHDEISLPEVGTFVAELAPAVFSDKGFSINPPYRKLSFRQRPSNDTLIAEAYANVASISLEQATADLVEFLVGLKEILVIKKTILFPGLGKMRATKENVFFFVPDPELDIYPDGYGLDPVSLRTHGGEFAEVPEPITEYSSSMPEALKGESQSDHVESSNNQPEQNTVEASQPYRMSGILKIILIAICVAIVLAAALAVLGRVAPEFMDKILYSAEDYKLLHG